MLIWESFREITGKSFLLISLVLRRSIIQRVDLQLMEGQGRRYFSTPCYSTTYGSSTNRTLPEYVLHVDIIYYSHGFHCPSDDSGRWGKGGLFSALAARSLQPQELYELAGRMKGVCVCVCV